jgi:hypothetical protein
MLRQSIIRAKDKPSINHSPKDSHKQEHERDKWPKMEKISDQVLSQEGELCSNEIL